MQVEQRGAAVMPFDQARTMHMFQPTLNGGTETIVSNDHDPRQIALIRSHLGKEAEAFAKGDYADPMAIHGMQMPGVATLRTSSAKILVAYQTVADGARLTFSTKDAVALQAIHDWFAAQASDHGSHAMMMD
jgi:hypothetical protein